MSDHLMQTILDDNFFYITSETCDAFMPALYGFAIQDERLLVRKNPSNRLLDKETAGMYVNIIEDGDNLIIQQDYWCGFGLYIFQQGNYWAVSNSLLLMIKNIYNRFNITVNDDYAALYILSHCIPNSITETIIKEIHELQRGEYIIIDKKNKILNINKVEFENYLVDVYNKEAANLIDQWYNKYLNMLGTLLGNGYNVSADLSGGFDTRSIFGIARPLLTEGLSVKSYVGKGYTLELDIEIARKISKIYNFELNMPVKTETFKLTPKQSLLINLYSRIFVHDEFSYHKVYHTKYEYRIGGGIGEALRGSTPHSAAPTIQSPLFLTDREDFLKRIFYSYKDDVLINKATSLLLRDFQRIDVNFKANLHDSQKLYILTMVKNHCNRGLLWTLLTNTIMIEPFLDPLLYKLNMTRHGVKDLNILHAILINRYLPELRDVPFENDRRMASDTLKLAEQFNRDFPPVIHKKFDFEIIQKPIKGKPSADYSSIKDPEEYMHSVYTSQDLKNFVGDSYGNRLWLYGEERKNSGKWIPDRIINKLNSLYFLHRLLHGKTFLPDLMGNECCNMDNMAEHMGTYDRKMVINQGIPGGLYDFPLYINWIPTNQCNFNCSYCPERAKHSKGNDWISLEQTKKMFNNLASLNRAYYSLIIAGGGEPTYYPHLCESLLYAANTFGKKLIYIILFTNGSRCINLADKLSDVANATQLRLFVSLHTDHIKMDQIKRLVEIFSDKVRLHFQLMFNPAKKDYVMVIHEKLCAMREYFPFTLHVQRLRNLGNDLKLDDRYTDDDLLWLKDANKYFNDISPTGPSGKHYRPSPPLLVKNRYIDQGIYCYETLDDPDLVMDSGKYSFPKKYCVLGNLLSIIPSGYGVGAMCKNSIQSSKPMYEITMDKDSAFNRVIECDKPMCGCFDNWILPRFQNRTEAEEFLEYRCMRQQMLVEEYADARREWQVHENFRQLLGNMEPHAILEMLVDSNFYYNEYPDVAASGMSAAWHYARYGAKEGRKPNAWFDTRYYLSAYPDIASMDINPLVHYVRKGAAEGRLCSCVRGESNCVC